MATIDQLIVSLILDPKGFKTGSDEAQKQSKKTTDALKKDAAASSAATVAAEQKRIKAIDDAAKKSTTASKKAADSREKDAKRVGVAEKKSADETVSSFRRIAAEFIGMFFAVRSVQDVVGFFESVNASTRQLGIDSKNFGLSAAELRDWQNAAVLAGGTAEGVTQTIANLQKSVFNMQSGAQVDDHMIYLARLGIQVTDTANKVLSFNKIMMQAADIMERNGRPREENFQWLQAAGFDSGSIQQILAGTAAMKAFQEQQKKLPQINDADVASATRLAQSWELLKQKVVAGGQKLLTALDASGAIDALFGVLKKLVDYVIAHQDDIVDFFNGAVAWVKGPGGPLIKAFFTDLAADISTLAAAVRDVAAAFDWLEQKGDNLGGAIFKGIHETAEIDKYGNRAPRGVRNNNPGNIKGTGDLGRDPEGFAVFSSPEKGDEALNKQLALDYSRGRKTITQLITKYEGADVPGNRNNVPAYIASVSRQTGIAAGAQLTEANLPAVAAAIAVQEGNAQPYARSTASAGRGVINRGTATAAAGSSSGLTPIPAGGVFGFLAPNPGALAAARSAQPTPGVSPFVGPPIGATGGSSTSMQFDHITVNTQATDAYQMAADVARALRRKLLLAKAEPGLA
jgi:hypothetical protein